MSTHTKESKSHREVQIIVSYHLEELSKENAGDWEALNQRSQYGSFFHTVRWKMVLERSFGVRARYFLVYKGEEPVALCPLCQNSLRGFNAIGPPSFSPQTNIIISEASNKAVMRLILKKVMQDAKANRSAYLLLVNPTQELRNEMSIIGKNEKRNMIPFPLDGNQILDLQYNSPTDIWNDIFDSKVSQRKYIKRFERDGFEVKETRADKDLALFYKYYSENLKQKGAIPFDRSHFDEILREYSKQDLRMTLLQRADEIAGGIIAFLYPQKKTMYLEYMALNRNISNTYHPPYALYWEAITYAYDHGCNRVCFGISAKDPQNKSYQIKKGFGCQYFDVFPVLIPTNRFFGMTHRAYMYAKKIKALHPSGGYFI